MQPYSHIISVTHNIIIFLETCSYYREPSKTKVPAVFLVITTSLLQLPIVTTSLNVIHLHVSVLGSRSNFMHVSDMCIAWLQVYYMIKA